MHAGKHHRCRKMILSFFSGICMFSAKWSLRVPPTQSGMRCDVGAHTNHGNTKHCSKVGMGTKGNSWVMLFVCTGKILFRGIISGKLSIMDACI